MSSTALAPARAPRFTPERRHTVLARLENGMTVTATTAETGITTAVVYQRRRRDTAFTRDTGQTRACGRERASRRSQGASALRSCPASR
ncbi:hypothetical protein ACGFX2_15890 [Streptomyces goshikiensis]|uniref:hypothetical protein n=1 Tax=Streptomyces goshikiensis TaxID=1942 RepID=UPI00371C1FCD